jgi:GWxTD domain-containing protein
MRNIKLFALKYTLFFFLILTFFYGCISASRKSKRPQNASLKIELPSIHPNYTAYHESKSITKIFFNVASSELLYMRAISDKNDFVARVKISYKLLPTYTSTQILDSATVFFTDTIKTDKQNKELISGSFEIKMELGNIAILDITMIDANRNNDAFAFLSIDKRTTTSRQNFYVSEINSQSPVFKNYVTNSDSLNIAFNKTPGLKKLFIKYFKSDFALPPPPFSAQERKVLNHLPDSEFTINLDINHSCKINFLRKGIYQFVADSNSNEGLSIIKYDHSVPVLNNEVDMIKSLRFITTKQEYDELLSASNIKFALDKYWLKCASNNKDKARLLIKTYYSRIEKCNNYFSSYDEGWKTDRGLVFLIFGAPNSVSRDTYAETWVYGDESNAMRQVKFIYTKVENPFSDNDYVLNRSESYKELWYRNVDSWRMGRVTNDKQ